MAARTRPLPRGTRPVLIVLLATLLVTSTAGPAVAAPTRRRAPLYYLALGDSLSRGVQPDPSGQNHPTDQGYADDLATLGRLVLPQLELVKLGCETEETTASMIRGAAARTPTAPLPTAPSSMRLRRSCGPTATRRCWSPSTSAPTTSAAASAAPPARST